MHTAFTCTVVTFGYKKTCLEFGQYKWGRCYSLSDVAVHFLLLPFFLSATIENSKTLIGEFSA